MFLMTSPHFFIKPNEYGHNETGTGERKLIWDEENRLLPVDDNGLVYNVLLKRSLIVK